MSAIPSLRSASFTPSTDPSEAFMGISQGVSLALGSYARTTPVVVRTCYVTPDNPPFSVERTQKAELPLEDMSTQQKADRIFEMVMGNHEDVPYCSELVEITAYTFPDHIQRTVTIPASMASAEDLPPK